MIHAREGHEEEPGHRDHGTGRDPHTEKRVAPAPEQRAGAQSRGHRGHEDSEGRDDGRARRQIPREGDPQAHRADRGAERPAHG